MGHAYFDIQIDKTANARHRRTFGKPSEVGYGNAFKVVCDRCKWTVFKADYGNPAGENYARIYMTRAATEHYEICIRG